MKPRLLLVGRTHYALPLDDGTRRKFDALEKLFELRVLASAPAGSPTSDHTFRLVAPARSRRLDGPLFYAGLPLRAARELHRFRPHAAIVQGTHETAAVLLARALARSDVKVILDLHGDPRAATRLYGSPLRRLLDPLGDLLSAVALRRADAVRTISEHTSGLVRRLGREPAAAFPAYMELAPFLERPPRPLPERPQALFVGVLEHSKNVDGLAAAWRLAAPRLPRARLHIVGTGTREEVVRRLLAELPAQTCWTPALPPEGIAKALDDATLLVLPSRSEGFGRVVVEALCRGRPVIGSRVGGIRELVRDGSNGLLVDPHDTRALADAIVRVLGDRELQARLAEAARASAAPWLVEEEEYARRLRALVDSVLGASVR